MPTELWPAYCGYLIWLLAGLGDFLCHWRTDLPHTSGVAESVSHSMELALLGLAVVTGLAFEIGPAASWLIFAFVVAHAIVGYVDTRIAFSRQRVIAPIEQHIHSVLDMAPLIGFAWLMIATWPAPIEGDASLQLRQPRLPPGMWIAALLPPVVLCIVPALLELRAAWRVARSRRR